MSSRPVPHAGYAVPQSPAERDALMARCENPLERDSTYRLLLQSFEGGGLEGVILGFDASLPWELCAPKKPPFPQVREEPETRDENSIESSRRRAKKMIRWHCKNIGADHLITLTTRQSCNTPGELWTLWQRFVKSYRAATGEDLAYVAIPEPHPSNPDHWHLHVATRGFFRVNIARGIWWAICGGRGQGNVHAQYIKVRQGGWKAAKIACYVSKYVTKALITSERFNKRRYSVARSKLAERHRYQLEARTFGEALNEFAERFGVDLGNLMKDRGQFFVFPDGSGAWFQIPPADCQSSPIWLDPPF